MEYTLAVRLRDAGFPQSGFWWFKTPEHQLTIKEVILEGEERKNLVYNPSLRELIDACAKDKSFTLDYFSTLPNQPWTATSKWFEGKDLNDLIRNGSTAEEAVAMLYLQLNTSSYKIDK